MSEAIEVDAATRIAHPSRASAYLELTRPRIAVMILVATSLGFILAQPEAGWPASGLLLMHTLVGTLMAAVGASALNQVLEADLDGRMTRTRDRPIPSGRLSAREGLIFGGLIGVGGVCYLVAYVNPLAGLLGGITYGGYAFVYTPMKRASWRSVYVGAIPGALPPVIGWTGATGSPTLEAWLLFGIVFVWQLPHFAAIAWLYREDYRRSGFPMLSVIDPTGTRLCRHMIVYSLVLVGVSLLPAWSAPVGPGYAVGAGLLGLAFVACGLVFARRRSTAAARLHLGASVAYLPALLGLMVLDKVT